MEINLLYTIDLLGTFVFASSGVLVASRKRLDIFGAGVIGFVTAVGGGTIRDVLLGRTPVAWMKDLNYLWCILAAIVAVYFFKTVFQRLQKTMFVFDTIGIGAFTILGVERTLEAGLHPVIAIMMGAVSAVFGGLLRDILCNEIPVILRKEVYATACLAGAGVYVALGYWGLESSMQSALAILFIIIVRFLAVRFKWRLPVVG